MTKTRFVVLLVLTSVPYLLITANAQGQVCALEDTIQTCQTKLAAEAAAGNEIRTAVMSSETGVNVADTALTTATETFLPLIPTTGLIAGDTRNEETSGTAVVDLNFLLPTVLTENNGKFQVALNTEATLYEPLKLALEEGQDPDAGDSPVADLGDSIADVGEATFSLSANWKSARLGRYFGPHRPLFGGLVQAGLLDPLRRLWANKPECLESQDLDDQVSAHLGLKYSVETDH